MNILFLASLFILFFFSYLSTGKDFLNTSTMLCLSFLMCMVSAMYMHSKWQFSLSADTIIILDSFIFLTILINVMVHNHYIRKKHVEIDVRDTPIIEPVIIIMGIMSIAVIFLIVKSVVSITGWVSSFANMMLSFRTENAYSTNLDAKIPGYISQLQKLLTCYGLVLGYNLIWFWEGLSKRYRITSIVNIAIIAITPLFLGGRYGVLTFVIAIYFIYYFIKIRRHRTIKVIKMKNLFRTLLIVLALLYGFFAVKEFVGRSDNSDMIEYICHYAGGSIPNFDIFIHSNYPPDSIWGKETFYSLINGLRKLKLINVDYYYIHHEFNFLNGFSLGNVFVAIRDYIHDFGFVGAVILHTIFSLFFAIIYERAKKKSSSIGLILTSMVYFCVVMYGFQNAFFSNVISIGYLIQAVEIYILYKILITKRLSIKKPGVFRR